MKHRLAWNFAIIVVAAVAVTAALMLLPGQSRAQGGGISAQAAVGTAFTYQGRLVYNGSAVNGTCSLTFKLYDAAGSGSPPSGGNQIGNTVTNSSVSVSNGYFNANLDFGSSAFTGEVRWLEITINSCPGGASSATLNPRVELKPAPYALSLRPGAVISDSVVGSSVQVWNTNNSATPAVGLLGTVSSSTDGSSGVYGVASATSGKVNGVVGATQSTTTGAAGVSGWAAATSGVTYGVYGETNSNTDGTGGVYGYARPASGSGAVNGVMGRVDSTSPNATGVSGWATGTSGATFGVVGRTESNGGVGVVGSAPITGTMGIATATSGQTSGVFGRTDSTGNYAAGVYGLSASTSGVNYGVQGTTKSSSNYSSGVYGEADATSGSTYGVQGATFSGSNNAAGVAGTAFANSGANYGVYGANNSASGFGVYGTAPTTGTVGIATASSGKTYGVYGQTDSTTPLAAGVSGLAGAASGQPAGVYGETRSSNGYGVYGAAVASSGANFGVKGYSGSTQGTGVYGYNNATSGTTYGVYGESNSSSGYGVYSSGNAHVEGQLTWKPITGYLSIPAAAFNPTADGVTFSQLGHSLVPSGGTPATTYTAPAGLPHGATVTKLTFYWSDASASNDGSASLYQIDMSGSELSMGAAFTNGSSGTPISSTVTSISLSSIDNSQYGYYVWLVLPDSNVTAYGVVIEYTIDRPY